MSQELPQHIYTSTGRMDFETVAVSPKLSTDVLRQLEARAASYPSRRVWGDDAPSPPYVVRGFRLAGDEYKYGVGLLLYIGQALNRPEGNYVSHSYAIPHEVLQQQDYNLPWIAACLPINFSYYPARGTGADLLDPFLFDVNPIQQFRIFRFAVEEMTPAGIHALLKELVERAKDGQTLELEMPPPHPDLGRIFNEVMGTAPEAAPNPDALRLLRLAGAMAILPAAFKRIAAFTVNDGGSFSGEAGSEAFILRVKRSENPVAPATPAPWPWFDHCIELATAGRFEDLQRMQAWLTKLLPASCAPSGGTLDLGFDFYRTIVAPTGGRSADRRALIRSVGQFHGHDINVDTLYETIEPRLSESGMTYDERCDFIGNLCRLIAAAGKETPAKVFAEVQECLRMEAGRSESLRKQFLRGLPEGVQVEIWVRTYQKEEPPGRIPWKFSPHAEHLAFALSAFDPKLINNIEMRRKIVHQLAEALAFRHKAPDNFYNGSHRAHLDQILNVLYALVKPAENINQNLQDALVVLLADSFSGAMSSADFEQQLWRVVWGALGHSSSTGVHALANFVLQLSHDKEDALIAMLLRLPFARGTRRQTRDFLKLLGWRSVPIRMQQLRDAAEELGDALDHPDRFDLDEDVEKSLPYYHIWVRHIQKTDGWAVPFNAFLDQVQTSLRDLPAYTRFAVGVTYLFLSPMEGVGLFANMLKLFETEGDEIIAWCVRGSWGPVPARVRLLAMFLLLANERGDVKRSFDLVMDAIKRLEGSVDRQLLLQRLNGHLSRQRKIPAWVKQTLRQRLEPSPPPRLQ